MNKGFQIADIVTHFFVFVAVFLLGLLQTTRGQTFSKETTHPSPPSEYQAYLISKATSLQLADQRFWHLLLHYEPDLIDGFTSDADNTGFFLASNGRTNPQAELEATISAFFETTPVATSQQMAQCAFPARYRWLNQHLHFNPEQLPLQKCERFEKGIGSLQVNTITLVFADAYMNNPSSMFGHTLMRLDYKEGEKKHPLLSYAINYGAMVTTDNPILYSLYGLTGQFEGGFSILPYYLKVQEYVEWENRDLWEYELQLEQEQIDWIILHLWELGNARFDYYFFKENCSFHLLSLIELAKPELELTDEFQVWTAPLETIRLLKKQKDLIRDVTFRPARTTKLQERFAQLTSEERSLFLEITKGNQPIESTSFEDLDASKQAALLDLANDYLRYQMVENRDEKPLYQKQQRQLLSRRSSLSRPSKIIPPVPNASPEKGHDTSRFSMGGGQFQNKNFIELGYRPGYHTIMDPETGYVPSSQIQAFDTQARYFPKTGEFRLEKMTFIDIFSLFPINPIIQKISWRLTTHGERWSGNECKTCPFYSANGKIGLATNLKVGLPLIVYSMAQTELNLLPFDDNRYRWGSGIMGGLLTDISPQWRLHASTSYLNYASHPENSGWQGQIQQRYTIARNWAVAFDGSIQGEKHAVKASMYHYF